MDFSDSFAVVGVVTNNLRGFVIVINSSSNWHYSKYKTSPLVGDNTNKG